MLAYSARLLVVCTLLLVGACSKPAPSANQAAPAPGPVAGSAQTQQEQCLACATADDCTVLIAGCVHELSSTREQCVKDIGAAAVERNTRVDCEVSAADTLRGATLACSDQRCVLNIAASPGGALPRHVDLLAKP